MTSEPSAGSILACAAGPEKCLQSWSEVDESFTCNRCQKPMHPLCAAIDATKATANQLHNPDSIRICYNCLRSGESPNQFGVFSIDDSRPTKKQRVGEDEEILTEASPQDMEDLDWTTLRKPHPTITDLIGSGKVRPPQGAKKAIWWRLFHAWNMDDFAHEVENPLAFCNLCGKIIKLSKTDRSPTPLKRHLMMMHKEFFEIMKLEKLKGGPIKRSPGVRDKVPPAETRTKKGILRSSQLQAISQWIIETDQPLDVVESQSFRKMSSVIAGTARNFHSFDKTDIHEYIVMLAQAMRKKMRGMLSNQSIVHVQEYWTSLGQSSYQVDRAHWIDDSFCLQTLAVGCDLDINVTGGASTAKLWEGLGVSEQKQVQFTVSTCKDGASYKEVGGLTVFHGVEFELNQIAQMAYDALGFDAKVVIAKARALVNSIKSSAAASEFLIKAQRELSTFFPPDHEPLSLISDPLTDYWWSANEMTGRLIYLRKALEYMTLDARFEGEIDLLNKQEWEILDYLQQAWEPFSIASHLLQKQDFVSVGLVPMIFQIAGEDLNPDAHNGRLKDCFTKMHSSWEEKYGKNFPSEPFKGIPKAIWIAHALDPRFKTLDVFGSTDTSGDVIFDAVFEEMVSLRLDGNEHCATDAESNSNEKALISPKRKSSGTASALRAIASSRSSGAKRGLDRVTERLSTVPKSTGPFNSGPDAGKVQDECRAELEAYRKCEGIEMWIEQDDGSKDFKDPLPWWEERHADFPNLWELARNLLPIPATCAASQRAFDAEAYAKLARRCYLLKGSTNQELKLLKENLNLVDAFNHVQDNGVAMQNTAKSAEEEGYSQNLDEDDVVIEAV